MPRFSASTANLRGRKSAASRSGWPTLCKREPGAPRCNNQSGSLLTLERATHRRVSGKAERHVSRPFAFWPFPRGFSPISPLSPLGPRVRKDIAALPSASACAAKTPSQTLRVLKRSCPNQLPLFERWIGPHVAGARIRLPGSLPRNCLETASKLRCAAGRQRGRRKKCQGRRKDAERTPIQGLAHLHINAFRRQRGLVLANDVYTGQ